MTFRRDTFSMVSRCIEVKKKKDSTTVFSLNKISSLVTKMLFRQRMTLRACLAAWTYSRAKNNNNMSTEEPRIVTTQPHSPAGTVSPRDDKENKIPSEHPQKRRTRRMSLLSITAKPVSPATEATPETCGGIGRHDASLAGILEQDHRNPAAFQELQRKVERRRKRSVDTVTDDILAFERTVDLGIDDITTAISDRKQAEKDEQHRE